MWPARGFPDRGWPDRGWPSLPATAGELATNLIWWNLTGWTHPGVYTSILKLSVEGPASYASHHVDLHDWFDSIHGLQAMGHPVTGSLYPWLTATDVTDPANVAVRALNGDIEIGATTNLSSVLWVVTFIGTFTVT